MISRDNDLALGLGFVVVAIALVYLALQTAGCAPAPVLPLSTPAASSRRRSP